MAGMGIKALTGLWPPTWGVSVCICVCGQTNESIDGPTREPTKRSVGQTNTQPAGILHNTIFFSSISYNLPRLTAGIKKL